LAVLNSIYAAGVVKPAASCFVAIAPKPIVEWLLDLSGLKGIARVTKVMTIAWKQGLDRSSVLSSVAEWLQLPMVSVVAQPLWASSSVPAKTARVSGDRAALMGVCGRCWF
jgi:hypothetical protein